MIFIVSKIHWLLFSWFWTRGNGSTDTTLQEKKVRKINRRFNTTKAFERCDNYAILLWLLSDILLWLFGLFTALHHSSKWQINCITPLKFSASLLHAFSRHSTKERNQERDNRDTFMLLCLFLCSRQLARSNKVRCLLHLKMNVNLVHILFMEKWYFHLISFTQGVKKSVKS